MKRIALSLLLCSSLFANPSIPAQSSLPFFKETPHFKVYCTPEDQAAAAQVLAVSENNFDKLTQLYKHTFSTLYKHTFSTKITLNIFHSQKEFHPALGYPLTADGQLSSPAWFINQSDKSTNAIWTISPQNPGTYHTAESILAFNITALSYLFINDTYKNPLPGWLVEGIGLWLAYPQGRYQSRLIPLAANHNLIPTFSQLDTTDGVEFDKINGFSCAYSLANFLQQKWGWDKVLALLANFANFEQILGINQDTFRTQWIAYLDENYLNKATK